MPEYRRSDLPGGLFFFTIVTNNRSPLFSSSTNVDRLRRAVNKVMVDHPFKICASVVLPDHLHFLWQLPHGDGNFSLRIARMKILFTNSMPSRGTMDLTLSKIKHRESGYWQRRFWEHTIRDSEDFQRHFDYIHYNPVKHDFVSCPHQWEYSSFHHWVRKGEYDADWCCACGNKGMTKPDFTTIARSVGE